MAVLHTAQEVQGHVADDGSVLRPGTDRRRAISWIPTTGGIEGRDIRDLMVESVEHRFGLMNQLPEPIEVAVR